MSKIDRAVQVSEIIGAAAIVISLIYVGSEVRRNTLSVQAASHQSSIAMAQDLDEHFFDAAFAIAYEAALADYSSLGEIEKRQFNTHVGSFLNIFEYSFYAHDRGIMDDEIWAGWERWMRSQFQLPAWQQVWSINRSGYGDRFQSFVDAMTSDQ